MIISFCQCLQSLPTALLTDRSTYCRKTLDDNLNDICHAGCTQA